VGTDAVATLIRREGSLLFAEDSFFVQIKTASQREIHFEEAGLNWLRALKLPYLLLSVDLKTASLELFVLVRASGHPNFRDRKTATFYLDEVQFDLTGDGMRVYLGPPILRWTPADAQTAEFQQIAYEVLREWIVLENEDLNLRKLGITRPLEEWKTNVKPRRTGGSIIMQNPKQIQELLQSLAALLPALLPFTWLPGNCSTELLVGLILMSGFMRQKGVDPDPHRTFEAIADSLIKQGKLNNIQIPPPILGMPILASDAKHSGSHC